MAYNHVVDASVPCTWHEFQGVSNLVPRVCFPVPSRSLSPARDGKKREPGNGVISSGTVIILLLVLALGHVLPALAFGHSRWHLYKIITLITRLKLHISLKLLLARNGLSCVNVCVVSCHLISYIWLKLYLPSGLCFLPKHWLNPMKRQISKRVTCILALVFFLPRT